MAGWKQKRGHMRHYNRTARIYNLRYAEEQHLKIKAAVENLELKKRNSILDLGCGTGLLLPKVEKEANITVGLDISKAMLKQVDSCIRRLADVHFILADADHTPLRDGYFDVVFAITLLQNMPNPYHTLQEIKRMTKPDATIIVTGLKKYFTERSFQKLLKNAKLKNTLLTKDDELKCHIAECQKTN